MKILKIVVLTAVILIVSVVTGYSQFWGFFSDTKKLSFKAEGNAGIVSSNYFTSGRQLSCGVGVEWAPFYRVIYFSASIKYANQYIHDTEPNFDIFTSMPNEIFMHSHYVRGQYGLKIRGDWFFNKIKDHGTHVFVGIYYLSDGLYKENTDLQYANTTTNSSEIFSGEYMMGKMFEFGLSKKFSDNFKLDLSLYATFQNGDLKTSSLEEYKAGFGLSTCIIY